MAAGQRAAVVLRDEQQASTDVAGARGPATIIVELTVTDPHWATATDRLTVTVGSK